MFSNELSQLQLETFLNDIIKKIEGKIYLYSSVRKIVRMVIGRSTLFDITVAPHVGAWIETLITKYATYALASHLT